VSKGIKGSSIGQTLSNELIVKMKGYKIILTQIAKNIFVTIKLQTIMMESETLS
jgi:hypothetical protein